MTGWLTSPRFHSLALGVLVLIAAIQGVVAYKRQVNDFHVHWVQGSGFLEGKPYAKGLDTYPVPRMMFNGMLASMPEHAARILCYVLALAGLYGSYRIWSYLANGQESAPLAINRTAAILAALAFLPYLLRDLDECGLQILLLFFMSAAAYALSRQQPLWTGFWVATGIAYKVAPLLFVPFLIWKRQWRATVWTGVFVAFWAAIPAAFIGVDETIAGHERWFARITKVNATREAYPSLQDLEGPKPHNLSLIAMLARYLETYPANHRLFDETPWLPEHPWFRQFGNLDGETAYFAVRGILVGFGLLLAWRWRRAWSGANVASDLPGEWACVTMLIALLAPQCWKQHLVVVLPAAFLALRQQLLTTTWFRWRLALFALIAAVVLGSRHQLIGKETSILLLSYKVDSMACLLLMLLNLTLPRSATKVLAKIVPLPTTRARAA